MPKKANIAHDELQKLVKRDSGVLLLSELQALGLPASTASRRTRSGGPWQRLLPGTVLTFTGTPTPRQRAIAALKYAHSGAIITGRVALRAHGLKGVPANSSIHVLVPHRRQRLSHGYVIIERTRRMPEPVMVSGIRCAPVARAVIDACRRVRDRDEVRAIVAEAVQSGKCSPAEIAQELTECQRRGSGLPRAVLTEIAAGIRSVAEAKARAVILALGLADPMWNPYIFAQDGRFLGRPDAYWIHLGVALQIDSMAWHLAPARYRLAQDRQRELTKIGILVIPVAPTDLLNDPETVLAQIEYTLKTAADNDRPLPDVIVRPSGQEGGPVPTA